MNTFTESILDTTVDSTINAAMNELLCKYGDSIYPKILRGVKPGYDIIGNKYEEGDWAILFQGTVANVLVELAYVTKNNKNKNGELMFIGWNSRTGKLIRHTGPNWWYRSIKIDNIDKYMKEL